MTNVYQYLFNMTCHTFKPRVMVIDFIGQEVTMVTLTLTCETYLLTSINYTRNLVCNYSVTSFSLLKTRTCY